MIKLFVSILSKILLKNVENFRIGNVYCLISSGLVQCNQISLIWFNLLLI